MIKDIIKGFLVGGFMGLVGQILFCTVLITQIPADMARLVTMLLYGFVSVAFILSGLYCKLVAFGGHAADIPVSGLMFGAAMTCANAKKSGNSALASLYIGFVSIMKILGSGFVLAFILGFLLGPYKGNVIIDAPSIGMQFFWAFVICGSICAFAQFLTGIKVPFPIAAITLIVIGGGLMTKLGLLDILNTLTGAGAAVTAVGCGNGAYSTGMLAAVGVWIPFLLTALLDFILVLMGSVCGLFLPSHIQEEISK